MADQYQHLTPIPFLYQGDELFRALVGPDPRNRGLWQPMSRDFSGIAMQNMRSESSTMTKRVPFNGVPPGRKQSVSIVSESGFYTLAFRSNKLKAVEFRRWVAREVIPSTRRTGGYQLPGERADKNWTDKLTAVCLTVAELRRSYGPRKAALLAVDLWARVNVVVDSLPPQGELNLGDESNVVSIRPNMSAPTAVKESETEPETPPEN